MKYLWYTAVLGVGLLEEAFLKVYRTIGLIIQGAGLLLDTVGVKAGAGLIAIGEEMRGTWSRSLKEAEDYFNGSIAGGNEINTQQALSVDLLAQQNIEREKQKRTLADLLRDERELTYLQRMAKGENKALENAKSIADAQKAQRDWSAQQRALDQETWEMQAKPKYLDNEQKTAFERFLAWQTEQVGSYNEKYLQMTGDTAAQAMQVRYRFEKQLTDEKAKLLTRGILPEELKVKIGTGPDEDKMLMEESKVELIRRFKELVAAYNKWEREATLQAEEKKNLEIALLEELGWKVIYERKAALLTAQNSSDLGKQKAHLQALYRDQVLHSVKIAEDREDLQDRLKSLSLFTYGTEIEQEREANRQAMVRELRDTQNKFRKLIAEANKYNGEVQILTIEQEDALQSIRTNYQILGDRKELLSTLQLMKDLAEAREEGYLRIAEIQQRINAVQSVTDPTKQLIADETLRRGLQDNYRNFYRAQQDLAMSHNSYLAQLRGDDAEQSRISVRQQLEAQVREINDSAVQQERWAGDNADAIVKIWQDATDKIIIARRAAAGEEWRVVEMSKAQHAEAASQLRDQYQQAFGTREQIISAQMDLVARQYRVTVLTAGRSDAEILAAHKLYVEQMKRLNEQLTGDFITGWDRGWSEWLRLLRTNYDFGVEAAKVASDAMYEVFNAFIELSKTGFKDWEKAVVKVLENVLAMIQKLLLEMAIANIAKLIFGAAAGGAGAAVDTGGSYAMTPVNPRAEGGMFSGTFVPVQHYAMANGALLSGGFTPMSYAANGNFYNQPTYGLIGEAGPELVLPLTKPDRVKKLLQEVGLAYVSAKEFDKVKGLAPLTQNVQLKYAAGGFVPGSFQPITQAVKYAMAGGAFLPHGFSPISVPVSYAANGNFYNQPTYGLIGEAGPELVLPLTKPDRMKVLLQEVGLAYVSAKEFNKVKELAPLSQDVKLKYASGGFVPGSFQPITQAVKYASGGFVPGSFQPITQAVKYASGGFVPGHFTPIQAFATGGTMSGSFAPIQKFEGGGIVSQPVLTVVGKNKEADEKTVISPEEKKTPPQVIINVENKTGLPVELKKMGQRENQGQQIIDVVMVHLVTNPDFRAAIAGTR
jgi:lambda family phage tail tape measure protein